MAPELEAVVGEMLASRQLTLAVAESCTGGLLGHRLTLVSGCSRYFLGGVVAYADAAKVSLLGVDETLLARAGAVSADIAAQMAEGVARRLNADLGLAITGVAGPDGGTADKPVGLVFVALAAPGEGCVRRCEFDGHRAAIKEAASEAALELIHEYLLQ